MKEKFLIRPILRPFYRSRSLEITVENGVPPFSWSVTGDFAVEDATTTVRTNRLIADADASLGSGEVTVTDNVGDEVTAPCQMCSLTNPLITSWIDRSSDDYWQCNGNCGGWDGNKWTEDGPGMSLKLAAGATWHTGFRPTQVRVTYTSASVNKISVGLIGGGGDFGDGTPGSAVALDLHCTNDIYYIVLYITTTVSKIEFAL